VCSEVFGVLALTHSLCLSQNALMRRLPFCYATMLGTHNSGITLADGYGTLDPYFQKYFEWIKFAVRSSRSRSRLRVYATGPLLPTVHRVD